MKQLCVYCVKEAATTSDHIPPKVCFPKPRPNLLTVPCCEKCNNQYSIEDEQFASFLSLRVGMDTPTTQKLHEKNKRITAHNRRLLRAIREQTEVAWIDDGGVVVGQGHIFKWEGKEHDRMVRRVIRGLFYHVFRSPLSPEVPVHGAWSKPFSDPELFEMWSSYPGENIGDEGQFRYRYAFTQEDPSLSAWMMTFYDRHFATGHTGFRDDEI